MFVSDSNLFGLRSFGVKIFTIEGNEFLLEVAPDEKITNIKERAVRQLQNSDLKSDQFRLVHVRLAKTLKDLNTVNEEGIVVGEPVLLVRRREYPGSGPASGSAAGSEGGPTGSPSRRLQCGTATTSAPTGSAAAAGGSANTPPILAEINTATADLPPLNEDRHIADSFKVLELGTELSKIVVTLVEMSLKMLTVDPNAGTIFLDLLKMRGYSLTRTGQILQHDTSMSATTLPSTNAPSMGFSKMPTTAQEIMTAIRESRKKTFRYDKQAYERLTDMGFEGEKVIEALLEADNNEEHAFDVLVGDRPKMEPEKLEGLAPDSPIIQRLETNPSIMLSLNNPRILKALVAMLEHLPSNEQTRSNQWLADQELAPLLTQVLRLYDAGNCTLR